MAQWGKASQPQAGPRKLRPCCLKVLWLREILRDYGAFPQHMMEVEAALTTSTKTRFGFTQESSLPQCFEANKCVLIQELLFQKFFGDNQINTLLKHATSLQSTESPASVCLLQLGDPLQHLSGSILGRPINMQDLSATGPTGRVGSIHPQLTQVGLRSG